MSNELPAGLSAETDMFTTRRSFLVAAASPFTFSLTPVRTHYAAAISELNPSDLAQYRNDLLSLVNVERASAGMSSLAIDDLACRVADQHALDLASGKFQSHWRSEVLHLSLTKERRSRYHRASADGVSVST